MIIAKRLGKKKGGVIGFDTEHQDNAFDATETIEEGCVLGDKSPAIKQLKGEAA